MAEISFTLLHPPKSLVDGSIYDHENIGRAAPLAGIFHPRFAAGTDSEQLSLEQRDFAQDVAAIGQQYCYLALLSQNLEVALRGCLLNIDLFLQWRHKAEPFNPIPDGKKTSFWDLVNLFEQQLDDDNPGNREFISQLHNARMVRNDFIHKFYDFLCPVINESGSRKKFIARLERAEKIFFPLVLTMQRLENAYADDLGFTKISDAMVAEKRREREERQKNIEEILDEVEDDENEQIEGD